MNDNTYNKTLISKINSTSFWIYNKSITEAEVEAIVNSTNQGLSGGGGVDRAVHKAAGKSLDEYCQERLKECNIGEAKISPAFDMRNTKHIIHTVGPVYDTKFHQENEKLLSLCYESSLEIGKDFKDIAFCNISTGSYGFPLDMAFKVTKEAIENWITNNPDTLLQDIYLCIFAKEEYEFILSRLAREI